ncbi:MAG: hypothetical protein ACRC9R_09220 [Enterovibrio sp.]
MQPTSSHNLGANGAGQAQGASSNDRRASQDQPAFDIAGVRNAATMNPSLLGNWQLVTTLETQNQANITLHLQRRILHMLAAAENQPTRDTAQILPTPMQPLAPNAEAISANFTVETLPQQADTEPQSYRFEGMADASRITLSPVSAQDRQKLQHHNSETVFQTTLNAMEVLADASITIETHGQDQTLTAKQSLKEVKFRRAIAAEPPPELLASLPAQAIEGAAAATQNDDEKIKQRLLETIQRSRYHFNPNNYTENCAQLKQNWTLCYYQGTTAAPQSMPTKVNIEHESPGDPASSLYADFWQNNCDGEDGHITLIGNRLTFTADDAMSNSARPLLPLPGAHQPLPQIFKEGATVLHLSDEALIVRSNSGEILGFANFD